MDSNISKEDLEYFQSLKWEFRAWKRSPALIDNSGFPSHQYIGQKYDPKYFTLDNEGWSHDHCEICYKVLCEDCDEGQSEGFVSNNQWLCISCYNTYIKSE